MTTIGVPREIKDHETRVAIVPAGVAALRAEGHPVLIERRAGAASAITDDEFAQAGATICQTAAEVWTHSDLILKVKEPQPEEYPYFRQDLMIFTYLHLAPEPELTQCLLDRGVTGIAYETVRSNGSLPLLGPMSEVAGRLAPQFGAHYLERTAGGRGAVLGGVPGVAPARVAILGGGVAGSNAARVSVGFGAQVTIIELNPEKLRHLDDVFQGRVVTLAANPSTIDETVREADLVIGAVLVPGAEAPKIVRRETVARMKPGSVVVDIAIDQGGCLETSHKTTHSDPIYVEHGVIHYCVTNMPAAVPNTSTHALVNATLPYVQRIARLGLHRACELDEGLAEGINTFAGYLTNAAVAKAQQRKPMAFSALYGATDSAAA